jgi:hypothetical protein
MFCDMVGSSTLATRLDPEKQGEVISAFHACCTNEIRLLGGTVAQYLGDGVLAYFGYPTAHENDAERAIGAPIRSMIYGSSPTARESQTHHRLTNKTSVLACERRRVVPRREPRGAAEQRDRRG